MITRTQQLIPKVFVYASIVFILLAGACSRSDSHTGDLQQPDETALLLNYLEDGGSLVNDPGIPNLVGADDLYGQLVGFNQLVIDLRPVDEYAEGHIANSVNIMPRDVLDYFENTIDPNAFERIVMVCNNAMLSGYVTAVMRTLGYNNVFFLRNGLSSWDMGIAQQYWLAAMGSYMEGKLETTAHPKNEPGPLPAIQTGETNAYGILRARAAEILQVNAESTVIPAEKVFENPSDYYIINYWPKDLYEQGHIAGSIQYDPKASFGKDQFLSTLPTDKPIVLYCYTAHHSTYPVAYLRLLGYDAWHIPYGVNSFLQQTMLDTQPPRRSFVPDMVKNYPLTGLDKADDSIPEETEIKTETITIQGGC